MMLEIAVLEGEVHNCVQCFKNAVLEEVRCMEAA
jgi:hypothetical protein